MTLTAEQIKKIDTALGKMGIACLDIRYELTDHVANVLEEKGGDFENELEAYLKTNKKSLKKMNRKMFFSAMGGTYKILGKTMLKPYLLIGTMLLFGIMMLLKEVVSMEMLSRLALFVYCLVMGYTSYVFLFRTFMYRRSFSGGFGFGILSLALLYLSIFMSGKQDYFNDTAVVLYFTIVIIGSIAMLITAEKQYKSYKFRYEG